MSPTREQIDRSDTLRAKFLSAIYDLTRTTGRPVVQSPFILEEVNEPDLSSAEIGAVLNSLIRDFLVVDDPSYLSGEDTYPQALTLTSAGAHEVERWIRTDEATDLLPIPPTTVFETHFHATVEGSPINIGNSGPVSNVVRNQFGAALDEVVTKVHELLAAYEPSEDEAADVEDSVATLQEQAATPTPDKRKIRVALNRLLKWPIVAGTTAGLTADLSDGLKNSIEAVFHQLTR